MKQLIFTLLMGVTFLSLGQSYNPDANGNTQIDVTDMLTMLSYFGESGPWAPTSNACRLNRVSGNGPRYFYIPDDCDDLYFSLNTSVSWPENWFYLPDSTWQNRKVTFYMTGSGATARIVDGNGATLFYCGNQSNATLCDWDTTFPGGIRFVQFMFDLNNGWQRVPLTMTNVNGFE